MPSEIDLAAVKPYADHRGDGLVQMSFTLPVPYGLAARKAAQELAIKMGFEHPEVVHYQELTDGYTYFVMFGEATQTVDYASLSDELVSLRQPSPSDSPHPPTALTRRQHGSHRRRARPRRWSSGTSPTATRCRRARLTHGPI